MRTGLLLALAAVLLALGFISVPGCVTTKTPDGTTVTRVDMESTVAILQASVVLADRRANVEMLQSLLGRELKKASGQ